jgi:hypothetical protein
MKAFEAINPEDIALFTHPEGDCPRGLDGPALFAEIFDRPGAPRMDDARWYIERVPQMVIDEVHISLRAQVMAMLQDGYDHLKQTTPFPPEHVEQLTTAPGIDLVQDIALVVSDHMIDAYVAVPDASRAFLNNYDFFDSIFDFRLSKVGLLDEHIGIMRAATRADPQRAKNEDLIPSFVVARNTLINSLALSVEDVLLANAGGALATLEFPPMLTVTALPSTYRVRQNAVQGKTRSYEANQPYACPVSMRTKDRNPHMISSFGDEPKNCLGRTASILMWRETAEALNKVVKARLVAGQTHYNVTKRLKLIGVNLHRAATGSLVVFS